MIVTVRLGCRMPFVADRSKVETAPGDVSGYGGLR